MSAGQGLKGSHTDANVLQQTLTLNPEPRNLKPQILSPEPSTLNLNTKPKP